MPGLGDAPIHSAVTRQHRKFLALAAVVAAGFVSAQTPPRPSEAVTHLFFDWNSAKISSDSAKTLDALIAERGAPLGRTIELRAFSDRSGSRVASRVMARRRADAVKAYFVEKGVPITAITTRAFGARRLLIPTPAGVREAQNRRVDVRIDPASAE